MPSFKAKADEIRFGWLDLEDRWNLPVHQPAESNDFDSIRPIRICSVCSYWQETGKPREPIPWPCPAQRWHGATAQTTNPDLRRVVPRIFRLTKRLQKKDEEE